jgi:hypothetical protein
MRRLNKSMGDFMMELAEQLRTAGVQKEKVSKAVQPSLKEFSQAGRMWRREDAEY